MFYERLRAMAVERRRANDVPSPEVLDGHILYLLNAICWKTDMHNSCKFWAICWRQWVFQSNLLFVVCRLAASVALIQVLGTGTFALCGALSGAAASIITNPMDIAKLRLQVAFPCYTFSLGNA